MNIKHALLTVVMALSVFSASGIAQQPALIDREDLFGNPEYAAAQISPDGKFISFVKPYKDTMNIWVKGVDEAFTAARPMTADTTRPVRSYFWSHDSKYILFVQDKGGDENFNVYAVSPLAKPAAGSDVPAARNLTDVKGIRAMIQAVPKAEPDIIYVGINDRDKAWHDVYRVKISTGERTLVAENKDRYQGLIFDNAGKPRLAVRSAQNGDTEILRLEADGKATKIYSCGMLESCGAVRFQKDNKQVYFQTNKGDSDLVEFGLLDPATGNFKLVERDPLERVDFGGAEFSDVSDELISTSYEDDRTRIYWKDKKYEKIYNDIRKRLGDREISFNSATADESKMIVATYSDTDPGTVWLYTRKGGNLSTLYQVREKVDRKSLAPMKPITYKSSDGLEIPAYLTLPKGVEARGLPLVVVPHGGPWGRDSWGYSPMAQFLANRGYAVLQPNFRASTGYGKKFINAGNNEWGQKMQDDITWGVKHLAGQGIVDINRVGIMGGSYGGYAALAGVAFTPDLYAAAVAIVAPSNTQTLLDAIPPYWEAMRKTLYYRMGDPSTPEGLAQMKRQSPLYSADKIKTPLMVVQGANDPRVNVRESNQIVVALRDRNYPVEYILAPDEGHGFARPVNNMAMFAAAEKFLAKHLGGRYQATMTPEVQKRLGEITVDPKTVKLEAAPTAVPASTGAAAALGGKWSVTAVAQGMSVDMAVEMEQKGNAFTGSTFSEHGNGKIVGGAIAGNKFTGTMMADIGGNTVEFAMEGTIDGDKITGTFTNPGFGSLPFSGTRNK